MPKKGAPTISLETRLEANGIVDRLTEDGDTFPADLAERLVAILPRTRRPGRVNAEFVTSSRGGAVQGATTTGHTASADAGRGTRTFTVGSDGSFRIGQWKVSHVPGEVEIARMMQGHLPETCLLRYSVRTGKAVDMAWPRRWELTLGRATMAVSFGWRRWKVPAPESPEEAAHAA